MKILISIFVIIGMAIPCFAGQANDKKMTSVIPDPNIVTNQVHTNRIKSLSKNLNRDDQLKKTHEYLASLETKELLEFAAELSNEKDFELSVISLVPHLKKKLSEYFPASDICVQIKDKKNNMKYRAFLIDIATKFENQTMLQIDNVTDGTSDSIEICETLVTTAEDKSNEVVLRRYALLQIGKNNSNMIALKKQEKILNKVDAWEGRLLKLYRNEDSPDVKGAAITAMRRSQVSNLENILSEVLTDSEDFNDIIIRHTVVSVAKSGLRDKYVSQMREIALAKNSNEVYGTTIYALGIIGNTEAICAIADAYHKHGFLRTIRSAFRKNEKTILDMLAQDKDDYTVSCGLIAVKLGRIAAAKELVESISITHENTSLRKDAQEILDEINTYETSILQHEQEDGNDK
ncbi:MAG: hypothetical protein ACYC3B_03665 [Sedimentisphaerales bacterium]